MGYLHELCRVLVVAWSPDAKWVASGDMNGMIWLWDPESGTDKGTLRGHSKWITSMVRSLDSYSRASALQAHAAFSVARVHAVPKDLQPQS